MSRSSPPGEDPRQLGQPLSQTPEVGGSALSHLSSLFLTFGKCISHILPDCTLYSIAVSVFVVILIEFDPPS